ncbi:serine/threonine-protein kinase [Streptomyces sp. NPDC095613]|uniref:serine/threonine-protein kinase n=1 Tax=Streptomyces sp. NPDC095613 TaxID=3155540 RepID=UPI0033326BA8
MRGGENLKIVDGRFELLERLGSGGMGTVWRARDTVLEREVALKEVRPPDPAHAAADPELARVPRERVLREARALARLSHPHVVTIHHIVDEGTFPWLVMELLRGESLQDRLARGPLEPREAARLGRQVLAALRAAHTAGIHHRDVKPANVMLRTDGSAVLTDFGIAALPDSSSLTRTGDLIGSPEYIAPERIRGRDDDPASDLWSLGVVLYVCVEGASPLRRATALATLAAVLDEPVPPPVRSGPLAPVLNALLVRDPAARPGAEALDRMLAEAENGTGPGPAAASSALTATVPFSPSSPSPSPAGAAAPPDLPPPAVSAPTPPYGLAADGPTARLPAASGDGGTSPAGPPDPGGPARPARRSRRTPVLVTAVTVAVALVAATAVVLAQRGDDSRSGAGGSLADREATTEPAGPAGPTAQPPGGPSKDAMAVPPKGSWIAQLAATSKASGTSARDHQAEVLRTEGIEEVRYVDSDRIASLLPGYWLFYVPGFDNGADAVSWCRSKGLATKDACLGRYVSDDGADRRYLCAPAPEGGTRGTCARG